MSMKSEYQWLHLLEEFAKQPGCNKEEAQKAIIEQKRKIRRITNRPIGVGAVLRNDFESCIFKNPFPEYITTREEAIEYFEEYERLHYYPSPYDCTGQRFTSWYKVFRKPNGEWWHYHCISMDV